MPSLRTLVKPHRRAAARFVAQVRRRLLKALDERPDVKRSEIADELGVHRSVITRQLNGTADISLARVAEIAWALGYEPNLELIDISSNKTANAPSGRPMTKVVVGVSTTSGSIKRLEQKHLVHG